MTDRPAASEHQGGGGGNPGSDAAEAPPRATVAGRSMALPRRRLPRLLLGVALILGGALGFLPVLGFWMIPLGLAALAYDIPVIGRLMDRAGRRFRRHRG